MRADLIAAARLFDCDDLDRGPCDARTGLDPAAWCCPCVARALALADAVPSVTRADLDDVIRVLDAYANEPTHRELWSTIMRARATVDRVRAAGRGAG